MSNARIVILGRWLVLIPIGLILGCTESPSPVSADVVADESKLQKYVGRRVELVGTFAHCKVGPHLRIGDRAIALTALDEGRWDPKWPDDKRPQSDTQIRVIGKLEYDPTSYRADYCLRGTRVYLVSAVHHDHDQ